MLYKQVVVGVVDLVGPPNDDARRVVVVVLQATTTTTFVLNTNRATVKTRHHKDGALRVATGYLNTIGSSLRSFARVHNSDKK